VSDTSFTVDKLVERSLLRRRRSEQDRRIINLELTKKGHIIHEFMLKNYLTFCKNILQKLTEEEQEVFLNLLEKVTS
jgi:DNA-binding MarR family transcriptional regulator